MGDNFVFVNNRSSHSVVFLGKGVLKICSKFTREHQSRSAISMKLLCNFIEITLRHGCSPLDLMHIFRTLFYKSSSSGLFLAFVPNARKYVKRRIWTNTAWKVSKYGVFSDPHFPVFGLNTGKYGAEKTPYLNSFDAVEFIFRSE